MTAPAAPAMTLDTTAFPPHFETEEALMQEYGYAQDESPDAHRHQAEHRGFTQQVIAVREKASGLAASCLAMAQKTASEAG